MDAIVRRVMKDDLAKPDVARLTNGLYEIVLYEDIAKYKTLQELLGKNNGVVLLYQTTSKYEGHWVCMWVDTVRDVHGHVF